MSDPLWTSDMEKQVGERLQIVMRDADLLKVYQKFGGEIFRRSSVFHGLGRFLAEQKVRGRLCFEIGTWNGLTAVVLSRFFDRVISVDIAHNSVKHRVLDMLGIENVRCFDIANNLDKRRVAKQFDFDFAYLDGNHAADTPTDFALVRNCGRVLFHEAWEQQQPVWALLHSLPEQQVVYGGHGLAIWDASK